ncbi:MAG TPA: molybdopterin-dependent oxidoreductase, partial [Myxococcota bacterium]|nr:molybdopterin-dependent oxidoreductase [Myxococcota bacterium]
MSVDPTRRRLLAGLAGAALAGASRIAWGDEAEAPGGAGDPAAADAVDPTRRPGAPPSALGARSPFESPRRMPAWGRISATPLQALHGTLTPADLHFERHHGGVPAIDPARHELLLHGLLDTPRKLRVADLLRLPSVTRTGFIECSGNLRI